MKTIFQSSDLRVIETAEGYVVRSGATDYAAATLTQAFAFVQSLASGETPDPAAEVRLFTEPIEHDWRKPRMHR